MYRDRVERHTDASHGFSIQSNDHRVRVFAIGNAEYDRRSTCHDASDELRRFVHWFLPDSAGAFLAALLAKL